MTVDRLNPLLFSAIARRFERMADRVLRRGRAIPELNPHDEDLATPGIETIKNIVSEIEK
jgi:hypothetical protein